MHPTSAEELASVRKQEKAPAASLLRRYRAILIGLLLVPVNVYFLLYMEVVTFGGITGAGGPYPSTVSIFANAIMFLLALTALNGIFARRFPNSALTRSELLVIYVMLTISTAIVSVDFMDILVPMMTYPFRAATPENKWALNILPHIPHWVSVSDPAAIKGWYEGHSNLYDWRIIRQWLLPVGVWSAVIFAMLFVMFCINTIVRQQWMEHDRLQFPIVELPMRITEPGSHLFRSRLMWAGFAIAAGISIVNGLSMLYPSIPYIDVKMRDISYLAASAPWNAMGYTPISFYPYAIGIGFLLPLDMLFSCWFFFIVWRVVRIIGAAYGINAAAPNFPFMNEQALGAYYLVGIFALWSGRAHLARVYRTAFKGEKNEDEAGSPMRYRTAVIGLVTGSLAIMVFFHFIGLRWWMAMAGIGMYFFLALAVARMHAEFGPPSHDLYWMGPEVVLSEVLGTRSFGAGEMTGLSWFWWFNRAYRSMPIAYQLDGMKIAQRSGTQQRYASLAMGAASVAAVVSGFWIYLHFGYQRGAAAGMAGFVSGFGEEAFGQHAGNWLANPSRPNIPATFAIVWGMIFTFFLYTMKLRFAWWPFHPLGFAVSTSYSIGTLWFPLMIAWAVKLTALRVGGMKTYRVVLDFFLGLLIGDFVMGCIWPLIGLIFGVTTYSYM